jgi:membrane-bound metal-dependent hydrolase YbcI (DUF457 family)
MKGFTHFISGAAIASCVPGAAEYAVNETSYILVFGGIAGILSDTLDFKFNKFFHRYDEMFDPGENPDPDEIASVVAKNIEKAFDEEKLINLHLHTIRVGADLWREYTVKFDEKAGEIVVNVGKIVNTGQVPIPKSELEKNCEGRAKVKVPFKQNYEVVTKVNIFSGPSFGFVKKGDFIDIQFIPWHRSWSHSITLGVLLGAIAWLVAALSCGDWLYPGWMFGAVVSLGFCTHVIEDQFGFLGSNLFFPFTKERSNGFKMMHSGDAIPNFLTVWLSVAILFWNMYRVMPESNFSVTINGFSYLTYVIIIPAILMIGGNHIAKRRNTGQKIAVPEETEDEEF